MKKSQKTTDNTVVELQQQLADAKKELFTMRLQQVSGQLENPLRIRSVRRSVARINTAINQAAKAEG